MSSVTNAPISALVPWYAAAVLNLMSVCGFDLLQHDSVPYDEVRSGLADFKSGRAKVSLTLPASRFLSR